ncbi:MAG: TIR domain-containing protein [Pseudomonadota bacterium]
MPDYDLDLFVSYTRIGRTRKWIEDTLVPKLAELLELELAREPRIFVDTQLDDGGTWPVELGQRLGSSRVLLALWSKPYRTRRWTVQEFTTMRAREESEGLRTVAKPHGAIMIAKLHDGETIPSDASIIQTVDLRDYFNPYTTKDSVLNEKLYDRLSEIAPDLAKMIENVPAFKPEWVNETANAFYEEFYTAANGQTHPPRFSI